MIMKQKLSVFKRTMNYLFRPRVIRDLDNVDRMRKKYGNKTIGKSVNCL